MFTGFTFALTYVQDGTTAWNDTWCPHGADECIGLPKAGKMAAVNVNTLRKLQINSEKKL